jgi:hypothetical protein
MTAFARFAFSSGAEVERAYEVLQADVPRHERDCAAGPPRKVEITAENVRSHLQRVRWGRISIFARRPAAGTRASSVNHEKRPEAELNINATKL